MLLQYIIEMGPDFLDILYVVQCVHEVLSTYMTNVSEVLSVFMSNVYEVLSICVCCTTICPCDYVVYYDQEDLSMRVCGTLCNMFMKSCPCDYDV